MPTFEQLIKNRILCEKRFYLSNSNSKWLSVGVTPSTKILDEDARGFQTEIFLCGEKGNISLGGIDGAAALFKTFRAMAHFAPMYTAQRFDIMGPVADYIVVTKANFGNEVFLKKKQCSAFDLWHFLIYVHIYNYRFRFSRL